MLDGGRDDRHFQRVRLALVVGAGSVRPGCGNGKATEVLSAVLSRTKKPNSAPKVPELRRLLARRTYRKPMEGIPQRSASSFCSRCCTSGDGSRNPTVRMWRLRLDKPMELIVAERNRSTTGRRELAPTFNGFPSKCSFRRLSFEARTALRASAISDAHSRKSGYCPDSPARPGSAGGARVRLQ